MTSYDIEALNLFLHNNGKTINPSKTSLKYIKKHYNDNYDLFNYLDTLYDDLNLYDDICEILYRIKNNISKNPGCVMCGNKVSFLGYTNGYVKTCSRSCMASYEHLNNIKNNKYEIDRINRLKIRRPELFFDWSKISDKNDEWILKHFLRKNRKNICPDTNKLENGSWAKNPINNDIINYIKSRFGNSENIEENLYWLYNKITERPVCPVCGGYLKFVNFIFGYQRVCSHSCASLHPDTQEKTKNSFMKLYGVSSYMLTGEFRKKSKETIQKRNKENYYNNPKSNITTRTSNGERKIFEIIKQHYDDVVQYYRDKRYSNPRNNYCWECDIYVPSIDLFIEYQGFRTHGPHPYNKYNKDDENRLCELKKRLNNTSICQGTRDLIECEINTWTKNDVFKRYVANKNGIKLLEIYEPPNRIAESLILAKINEMLN